MLSKGGVGSSTGQPDSKKQKNVSPDWISYRGTSALYELRCEAQFDASRRGKHASSCSRDKNEGTYRSGEGGGEDPAYSSDPGLELCLGRERERKSAKINYGMSKKKGTKSVPTLKLLNVL